MILRSIGQVMLQRNAMSGALMLVGIAIGSWQAALMALTGCLIGNITALLCKYDKSEINDGLYGFNGTLVGIAAWVFLSHSIAMLAIIIVAAALSTIIAHLFIKRRWSGYTAPFVIATWLMIVVTMIFPSLKFETTTSTEETAEWLKALSLHYGQVMLEEQSLWTGIFLLLAVAINDWRAALYSLWGATLPLLSPLLTHDIAAFNAGLYGYNAVLCAIALSEHKPSNFLWVTLAIFLSTLLQWAGISISITTLTAPFVITTWIVIALRTKIQNKDTTLNT